MNSCYLFDEPNTTPPSHTIAARTTSSLSTKKKRKAGGGLPPPSSSSSSSTLTPFIRSAVPYVNVTVANALRRTLLTSVPTYAISDVRFHVNTTCEGDEFIAHRLGLIPLRCLVEGQDDCSTVSSLGVAVAEFHVDVSCAEDAGAINLTAACLEHVNFRPVLSRIPIVTVGPGARIAFTARIARGVGKQHSKWSPVSKVIVRPLPSFTIDIEDSYSSTTAVTKGGGGVDVAYHIASSCPRKVFDVDYRSNESPLLIAARPDACTLCKECIIAAPAGAIAISPDGGASANNNFAELVYVAVHPVGQIPARLAVEVAFSQLRANLLSVAHYLSMNDGSCVIDASQIEDYM